MEVAQTPPALAWAGVRGGPKRALGRVLRAASRFSTISSFDFRGRVRERPSQGMSSARHGDQGSRWMRGDRTKRRNVSSSQINPDVSQACLAFRASSSSRGRDWGSACSRSLSSRVSTRALVQGEDGCRRRRRSQSGTRSPARASRSRRGCGRSLSSGVQRRARSSRRRLSSGPGAASKSSGAWAGKENSSTAGRGSGASAARWTSASSMSRVSSMVQARPSPALQDTKKTPGPSLVPARPWLSVMAMVTGRMPPRDAREKYTSCSGTGWSWATITRTRTEVGRTYAAVLSTRAKPGPVRYTAGSSGRPKTWAATLGMRGAWAANQVRFSSVNSVPLSRNFQPSSVQASTQAWLPSACCHHGTMAWRTGRPTARAAAMKRMLVSSQRPYPASRMDRTPRSRRDVGRYSARAAHQAPTLERASSMLPAVAHSGASSRKSMARWGWKGSWLVRWGRT